MIEEFGPVFKELYGMGATMTKLEAHRHRLFLHLMSSLGRQPVNLREGSACVSKAYLPTFVVQMVDDMQKAYASPMPAMDASVPGSSPTYPMVELGAKSSKTFMLLLPEWLRQLKSMLAHCQKHDGYAISKKREDMSSALSRKKAKTFPGTLKQFGLQVKDTFDDQIDVYPALRTAAIVKCQEAFDKVHENEMQAKAILDRPVEVLMDRLHAILVPQAAASLAALEDSAPSKQQDSDNHKPMTLSAWRLQTEDQEGGKGCCDSTVVQRTLLGLLQVRFNDIAMQAYQSVDGQEKSNLKVLLGESVSGKKGPKVTLSKVTTDDEKLFSLPFWGRVISESAAVNLPKATTISIGDNKGAGPPLYLDGTSAMNAHKTDCCFAWYIPPVPQPKKKDEEEEQENEDEPKKKKRKTKNQAKVFKPTHKICYEDLAVEVMGQPFAYSAPVLKDIGDDEMIVEDHLSPNGEHRYTSNIYKIPAYR